MSANTNTVNYKNACAIGAYLMEVLINDGGTTEKSATELMTSYTLICCKAFGQNGPAMSVDIAAKHKELYQRVTQ